MGRAMDMSTAMIAITIISSISVKPRRHLEKRRLPLGIGGSISRLVCALGIYIEQVLPTPGLCFGIVAGTAVSPLGGIGHRVFGNPAQVVNLFVDGAGGLFTFHQNLERLR